MREQKKGRKREKEIEWNGKEKTRERSKEERRKKEKNDKGFALYDKV